ncbi:MAG: hypothetical protein RL326_1411 [Pseudomonadota bacterium]
MVDFCIMFTSHSQPQSTRLENVARQKLTNQHLFDFPGEAYLPHNANTAAITHYLQELEISGADVSLIQYTDATGSYDIARFCSAELPAFDKAIDIQSTSKSIFTLFLIDTMGDFLWDNIDKPVETLVKRPLQELYPIEMWQPAIIGIEKEWGKRTLRQFLNHTSGTPFNDNFIAEQIARGEPALDSPSKYIRYSNTGVEFASAIAQQWIRENPHKFGVSAIDQTRLEQIAGDFLKRNFWPGAQGEPPLLTVGQVGEYRHIIWSGKIEASARQIAELPHVVSGLSDNHRERLFTPIGEVCEGVRNSLEKEPPYLELVGTPLDSSWHTYLKPTGMSNLFYRRPYGYATHGSFENNCDVVIQGCRENLPAAELASLAKNKPRFTVVRLQGESSLATRDQNYGIKLTTILREFFS